MLERECGKVSAASLVAYIERKNQNLGKRREVSFGSRNKRK